MDMDWMLKDERFATPHSRFEHKEELYKAMAGWFAERTKEEAMKILGEADVPAGAVLDIDDFRKDPEYKKLGIDIEIISGGDEARFDFIATTEHFGEKLAPRGVVVDMGGGSTEFIAYDHGEIKHICSLPIGSLGLWKSFCGARRDEPFPTESERKNIAEYVEGKIKKAAPLVGFGGTAYLIGGTARALSRVDASLCVRSESPDGYVMKSERFPSILRAVVSDTSGDCAMIKKICPDRTTSIVPGAVAYDRIISLLGVSRAVISLSGVREGFIVDYIRKTYPRETREI